MKTRANLLMEIKLNNNNNNNKLNKKNKNLMFFVTKFAKVFGIFHAL